SPRDALRYTPAETFPSSIPDLAGALGGAFLLREELEDEEGFFCVESWANSGTAKNTTIRQARNAGVIQTLIPQSYVNENPDEESCPRMGAPLLADFAKSLH